MTAKTTLTALLPDGNVATRKTHRTYTHILAVRFTELGIEREVAYTERCTAQVAAFETWTDEQKARSAARNAERAENARTNEWTARSWHGRLDLARRAADKLDRSIWEVVITEVNA